MGITNLILWQRLYSPKRSVSKEVWIEERLRTRNKIKWKVHREKNKRREPEIVNYREENKVEKDWIYKEEKMEIFGER